MRGRARGKWGEGDTILPLALASRKESHGVLEWRVYMGGTEKPLVICLSITQNSITIKNIVEL